MNEYYLNQNKLINTKITRNVLEIRACSISANPKISLKISSTLVINIMLIRAFTV